MKDFAGVIEYIEYLEQKKTEIVANHVRLFNNAELTKAEQMVIDDLNWQIKRLRNETD